jgi:hypothetical protein
LRGEGGDDALSGGAGDNTVDGGPGDNLQCSSLQTCDTQPPELEAFSIDQDEIDTSDGQVVVPFQVQISDDLSGLGRAYLSLRSPDGETVLGSFHISVKCSSTGPATGHSTVTFPRYAQEGEWTADYFDMEDRAGNYAALGEADFRRRGFDHLVRQIGPGDSAPPTLVSQSFSPSEIDTSSSESFATLRVHLKDDLAGVDGFDVVLSDPLGRSYRDEGRIPMERVSGSAKDGHYVGTIPLPRYAPQGEWSVSDVFMSDRARNRVALRTADLEREGLTASFTQVGQGDTEPPQLTGFDVSPAEVDTSLASQKIFVTVSVTDDYAGMDSGSVFGNAVFYGANGGVLNISLGRNLVSGDRLSGVYRESGSLRRYSSHGKWTLDTIWLGDAAGNRMELNYWELPEGNDFNTSFRNGPPE